MANIFQKALQKALGVEKEETKELKAQSNSASEDLVPFVAESSWSGELYPSSDSTSQLDTYKTSWVYACVSKRAEEISQICLYLYEKNKRGEEQEIETHPMLDLLGAVNQHMTFSQLIEHWSITMDLSGECFWWLLKNQRGDIIQIYPFLRPDRMSIVPNTKDFISGYVYQVPGTGEKVPFDIDEIIHFKDISPLDPYRGFSRIKAGEFPIATDKEASAYNWRFFKNNAIPGGILKYKEKLTETSFKRILGMWNATHGQGNNSKIAVLDSDADYKTDGISQRDMDFSEMRRFNRDEILAIFHMPKMALGIVEDVNKANAEVSKNVFIDSVVKPRMRKLVDHLNEFLVPKFKDKRVLFFDFEDPTPKDDVAMLNMATSGYTNGVLTQNESRQLIGFDVVPGGDTFKTAAPLQFPIKSAKRLQPPMKRKLTIKYKGKRRDQVLQELVESKIGEIVSVSPESVKKTDELTKFHIFEKEGERKWKSLLNLSDIEEAAFKGLLHKLFARQEKSILEQLNKKSTKDYLNFNVDAEETLFAEIFAPLIEKIIKEHGEQALKDLGKGGFDVSENVIKFIDSKGLSFARDVNETTKERLKELIKESLKEGEPVSVLKKKIQEEFAFYNGDRADRIARTEVFKSGNFGIVEGFKQSGVVEAKQWFTAQDERVDETCAELHGKIIDLDAEFKSQDQLFGTVEEPPAHVRCRCTVLPVLISR